MKFQSSKIAKISTLKVENFAGTKFRGFRGQPQNLIPAKYFHIDYPRNLIPAKVFKIGYPRNLIPPKISLLR